MVAVLCLYCGTYRRHRIYMETTTGVRSMNNDTREALIAAARAVEFAAQEVQLAARCMSEDDVAITIDNLQAAMVDLIVGNVA